MKNQLIISLIILLLMGLGSSSNGSTPPTFNWENGLIKASGIGIVTRPASNQAQMQIALKAASREDAYKNVVIQIDKLTLDDQQNIGQFVKKDWALNNALARWIQHNTSFQNYDYTSFTTAQVEALIEGRKLAKFILPSYLKHISTEPKYLPIKKEFDSKDRLINFEITTVTNKSADYKNTVKIVSYITFIKDTIHSESELQKVIDNYQSPVLMNGLYEVASQLKDSFGTSIQKVWDTIPNQKMNFRFMAEHHMGLAKPDWDKENNRLIQKGILYKTALIEAVTKAAKPIKPKPVSKPESKIIPQAGFSVDTVKKVITPSNDTAITPVISSTDTTITTK